MRPAGHWLRGFCALVQHPKAVEEGRRKEDKWKLRTLQVQHEPPCRPPLPSRRPSRFHDQSANRKAGSSRNPLAYCQGKHRHNRDQSKNAANIASTPPVAISDSTSRRPMQRSRASTELADERRVPLGPLLDVALEVLERAGGGRVKIDGDDCIDEYLRFMPPGVNTARPAGFSEPDVSQIGTSLESAEWNHSPSCRPSRQSELPRSRHMARSGRGSSARQAAEATLHKGSFAQR